LFFILLSFENVHYWTQAPTLPPTGQHFDLSCTQPCDLFIFANNVTQFSNKSLRVNAVFPQALLVTQQIYYKTVFICNVCTCMWTRNVYMYDDPHLYRVCIYRAENVCDWADPMEWFMDLDFFKIRSGCWRTCRLTI